MISTLIIIFLTFFVTTTVFIFQKCFVRGEIYDITKMKLSKNSKLRRHLFEFEKNIAYIRSLPYSLYDIKSNDGLKLAGKFFHHKDSNKVVILFHGYRSIAENDFSIYLKWFYENNFSVLLIDERSHGKSEGKYITFGVKERWDCQSWCEYVANNFPYVEKIYLCGLSMGATTILLASELELPNKVKGIIADSSFTSAKDIVFQVASRDYGMDLTLLFPLLNWICKKKAHFSLEECSVSNAMKNNKLPVLFIHGSSDNFVPSKMSKKNFEMCQTKKELVILDCVNHGFSCIQYPDIINRKLHHFFQHL